MKTGYALFMILFLLGTTACQDDARQKYGVFAEQKEQVKAPLKAEENITGILDYYMGLDNFRGQTADNPPAYFWADMDLGFKHGDAKLQTELTQKKTRIQDIIQIYLSRKKAEELKLTNTETLQRELLQQINGLLQSGKLKVVIIQELQVIY